MSITLSSLSSPSVPLRLQADDVIARLKRLQALEIQSTRLLGGWLPGVATWEVKHEIGLHLWQDAQHSRELRTRLWELRISNPDRTPDAGVARLTQGLASAQEDYEFLSGLYLVFKTELVRAYRTMVAGTHGVYDAPTIAAIRRILPEKEDQLAWAGQELKNLLDSGEKQRLAARWQEYIRRLLVQERGVTGAEPVGAGEELVTLPPGYSCPLPFAQAKRDARFKITLTSASLPKDDDRDAKVLFQFFNYTQEMQAAETLGSTLWEADGMEWEFYYEIARHCYDEVRHSALGEARLAQLGHHVSDFPNDTANYAWRQLYDPLRRYCVLTHVIEADSFKYKHQTYQEHVKHEDMESAEAVLYDIMDETMHVRYGHKWTAKLMERYQYPGPLEQLVAECREILINHSINPLQRASAEQAKRSS